MSKDENLKVGEDVLARWEGSRKYFKATVRHFTTKTCEVVFEDGTGKIIPRKDIQRIEEEKKMGRPRLRKTASPEKPRRRPSRGRSKTPSSSPEKASSGRRSSRGRSKTPSSPEKGKGRGRAPSRSPARSIKKSPTRKHLSTPPTPSRGKISEVSLMLKEVNISLEKIPIQSVEERRYPARHRVPVVKDSATKQEVTKETPPSIRPSTAASAAPSGTPSALYTKCPKGATFVSLLMVAFLAVLPLFLYLACTKNKGILLAFPPVPKRLQSYLSLKTLGIYLAFVVFQGFLFLIPLGRNALLPQSIQSGLHYRMNGWCAVLVTAVTIAGMAYYQVPLSYLHENMLRTIVASLSFATLSSLALYAKSFFTDFRLASNSGNYLYDFVWGREMNPRLWRRHFDLKLFALRLGLVGMATVDSLLLYKYIVAHGCVSYQLVTVATMQLLYVADILIREETVLATSVFLYEGVGYAILVTFLTFMPFVHTLPVLYLSASLAIKQQPWYCLASAGVIFVSGMYLSHRSLSDKYTFKSNPFNPALLYLEAIPSNFNRRLITSGLWGRVRHPNYLGEILMFFAWTIPCGFASAVPYVPLICSTLCLVGRTFIMESSMRKRHGQSWMQYSERVRHRLLPYVF